MIREYESKNFTIRVSDLFVSLSNHHQSVGMSWQEATELRDLLEQVIDDMPKQTAPDNQRNGQTKRLLE